MFHDLVISFQKMSGISQQTIQFFIAFFVGIGVRLLLGYLSNFRWAECIRGFFHVQYKPSPATSNGSDVNPGPVAQAAELFEHPGQWPKDAVPVQPVLKTKATAQAEAKGNLQDGEQEQEQVEVNAEKEK